MMNDEILTSDYFAGIQRRMQKVSDSLSDRAKDVKPMFGGTRLLTDSEACSILKVGKRTMQEYRTNGIVPYYLIAGKVLYREQDLEELLQRHYRKAFTRK